MQCPECSADLMPQPVELPKPGTDDETVTVTRHTCPNLHGAWIDDEAFETWRTAWWDVYNQLDACLHSDDDVVH